MAKKTIRYVENRLKKRPERSKVHYHLTTNLTLFPNDLIDWAKEYDISFNINVDGPKEIHDVTRPLIRGGSSYDRTARNLARLRRAGLKYHLRATATFHNQDILPEIARLHAEMGASSCAIVPVLPITSDENVLQNNILPDPEKVVSAIVKVLDEGIWKMEQFSPASQYLRRSRAVKSGGWWCNAFSGNIPVVDVNGDIYLDANLVGLRHYRLGNVFKKQENYPNLEICSQILTQLKKYEESMCSDCLLKSLCPGGCPLGLVQVFGNPRVDLKTREYFKEMTCRLSSSMVEAVLWQIAKTTISCTKDN